MESKAEIIKIEDIKKRSRHIFESSDFVEEAYLFGSYARGEATPESDIDFMIVLSRSLPKKNFLRHMSTSRISFITI